MNTMGGSGDKSGEVTKGSRGKGRKAAFKATGSLAHLNVTGVLRVRKRAPKTCSVKGQMGNMSAWWDIRCLNYSPLPFGTKAVIDNR